MKGMRELREVLRTVETKATQNFKVVTWRGPQGWVLGAGYSWFTRGSSSVGDSRSPGRHQGWPCVTCILLSQRAHGTHCQLVTALSQPGSTCSSLLITLQMAPSLGSELKPAGTIP